MTLNPRIENWRAVLGASMAQLAGITVIYLMPLSAPALWLFVWTGLCWSTVLPLFARWGGSAVRDRAREDAGNL